MVSVAALQPASAPSPVLDAEVDASAPAVPAASTSTVASDGKESSEESEPKLPLHNFVWGVSMKFHVSFHFITDLILQEKLIRNTLPQPAIPQWLDPLHVDVDDPRKLPLCWYGLPFCDVLVFKFARRVGLASYLTMEQGRLKDRKSTRLNSSHSGESRMPSSA